MRTWIIGLRRVFIWLAVLSGGAALGALLLGRFDLATVLAFATLFSGLLQAAAQLAGGARRGTAW